LARHATELHSKEREYEASLAKKDAKLEKLVKKHIGEMDEGVAKHRAELRKTEVDNAAMMAIKDVALEELDKTRLAEHEQCQAAKDALEEKYKTDTDCITAAMSKQVFPCGRCSTLRYTAPHCTTLQHTAAHCSTLQNTAAHCNTLQCTATHRNATQHTATHRNTLQHTRCAMSSQLSKGIACSRYILAMGWLRLVGSIKLQVSFAEYCLLHRALLQKRPII